MAAHAVQELHATAQLGDTIPLAEAAPSAGGAALDATIPKSKPAAGAGAEREKDVNLMYGAVEAQWILTVLDDASNKLSLCSYLTPDILKDRIMDAMDQEMVVALREHFQVEKQYMELLADRRKKVEEGENEADEQTQAMLNELDLCLSDSTRTVARLLKMNPLLVRRLREVCSKRSPSALEFINTFARLRKLVHNKLRMSAEEERAMKEQLEKLQEEEEEDTKRFLELTEGLAVERSEHKHTLAAKDRKIMRLRKQIEQLTLQTQQERSSFEQKMDTEAQYSENVFNATSQDLNAQLSSGSTKLENDGSTHWTAELSHHRKKYHSAQEVERLIQKYDREMAEKFETLTELKKIYTEEQGEMAVLQDYFDKVDAEIKRQEEEIIALTAARNEELNRERKRHEAALLMQKMFRGFHVRALAGAKKKAAAEGKDDKKKKK